MDGTPLLRWRARPGWVTRANNHRTLCGPSVFYRRDAVADLGGMATDLGFGIDQWYLAGEDSDFALRALDKGPIRYQPDLVVDSIADLCTHEFLYDESAVR